MRIQADVAAKTMTQYSRIKMVRIIAGTSISQNRSGGQV